eukprot:CAMPEP_0181117890 /NCGR_PEP_ID=MMETSP1071-20121207/22777_1 /TAXON_ID=35127 /ORGANISM="Thalassiosira sp., Strain NH16" /LENGTH=283 /DNA_ID=CAMNT_0023202335 /DNA_START=197 /DNA_END=1046 /DNA_ORIENTATION=-
MTTSKDDDVSSSRSLNRPFNNDHFESLPHVPSSPSTTDPEVGCGTYGRDVMTGRLLDWTSVVVDDDDDNNGGGGGSSQGDDGRTRVPPYVAVIDEMNYTADSVARLMYYASRYSAGDHYGGAEEGGEGPLRGVLVLASSSSSSSEGAQFPSPESPAPGGEGTPSASLAVGTSYGWNANDGDGLSNTDMYGLPTAYVYDADTANYLRGVASEQSKAILSGEGGASIETAAAYPSVLSEFNYYMGPGGEEETDSNGNSIYDSKKCLGWKDASDGEWSPRCAPLGG